MKLELYRVCGGRAMSGEFVVLTDMLTRTETMPIMEFLKNVLPNAVLDGLKPNCARWIPAKSMRE